MPKPQDTSQGHAQRVIGTLKKASGGWVIETQGGSTRGVRPKWKNRGQVQDRLLLWILHPPTAPGRPWTAALAQKQPSQLRAFQPGGRFPGGVSSSPPAQRGGTGRKPHARESLPEDDAATFLRDRDRGRLNPVGSSRKAAPAAGGSTPDDRDPSRSVRASSAGLPGHGKRR